MELNLHFSLCFTLLWIYRQQYLVVTEPSAEFILSSQKNLNVDSYRILKIKFNDNFITRFNFGGNLENQALVFINKVNQRFRRAAQV